MNNKDLKEYLNDVYVLEAQLHTYQKIEHQYDKYIQKLKHEKSTIYLYEGEERIGKNARRTNYVMPAPEFKADYLGEKRNKSGHREPIYGFQGAYNMFKRLPERWWDKELIQLEKQERNKYRMFHVIVMAIAIVIGLVGSVFIQNIIPFVVAAVIGGIACYYVGNETKKEYLPGDPFFERFMAVYTKKYKADLKKKRAEYTPQIEHVVNEYQTLVVPKLENTRLLLEEMYAMDILHLKFRNYAAVTQMYEYMDTNRCQDIEGAYSLYEEELKQNKIVADLNLSIYQLEKMSGSMKKIVSALKYEEDLIDKIKELLWNGEDNTTLIEYNKQSNVNNESIANQYKI